MPVPRPYKFLDAFGPADAALLCGRDHDLARLQRLLTASRLLILYGASGTGKTSVLQAGLLPSLPAERYAWVVVRMADAEPTAASKAALVRAYGVDAQILTQPLLEGGQAATATLGKMVVLILDQFEECFQRHACEVRQQLHAELRACLDAVHLEVHVVIALRADYYSELGEFQEDGSIPTIFYHTLRLTRFSSAQAYEAVVQPAQRLGLRIDEAFVQDVLLPQLTDAAWITPSERERTKVLELIARGYEVYKTSGLLLSPGALKEIKPFWNRLVLPNKQQRTFFVRSRQVALLRLIRLLPIVIVRSFGNAIVRRFVSFVSIIKRLRG
jgi:hypothetical protein